MESYYNMDMDMYYDSSRNAFSAPDPMSLASPAGKQLHVPQRGPASSPRAPPRAGSSSNDYVRHTIRPADPFREQAGFATSTTAPVGPVVLSNAAVAVNNMRQLNLLQEALPGSVVATVMRNSDAIAVAGIHILVHTLYGPPCEETYHRDEPFRYPFQHPYVAQSDDISQLYTTSFSYVPDASSAIIDGKFVTYQEIAEHNLGEWYQHALAKKFGATGDRASTFSQYEKQCFSIDLDPTLHNILINPSRKNNLLFQGRANFKTPPPETLREAALQIVAHEISSAHESFERYILRHFDADQDTVVVEPDFYADGALDFQDRAMRFLNHHVINNPGKMVDLISSNMFQVAVNDFMMNRFQGFDCHPNYAFNSKQQHVFVEVIGFTSAAEWNSHGSDVTYTKSRNAALNRWIERRRAFATFEDKHAEVRGMYMVQQNRVVPLYDTLIPFDASYFDNNRIFSEMQPVVVDVSEVEIDRTKSKYRKWKLVNAHQHALSSPNEAAIKSLDALTRLPEWTTVAFSDKINSIALSNQAFFSKSEFRWYNHPALVKPIGQGAYGAVIKLRWNATASSGSSQDSRASHHPSALYVLLSETAKYLELLIVLRDRCGELVMERVRTGYVPFIHELKFAKIDATSGALFWEPASVFGKNINVALNECRRALTIVAASIQMAQASDAFAVDSNAMVVDDVGQQVVAYTAKARTDVVLKLETESSDSIIEFGLNRLITSANRGEMSKMRPTYSFGDPLVLSSGKEVDIRAVGRIANFETTQGVPASNKAWVLIDVVYNTAVPESLLPHFSYGNRQVKKCGVFEFESRVAEFEGRVARSTGKNPFPFDFVRPDECSQYILPTLGFGYSGNTVYQVLPPRKSSLYDRLKWLPENVSVAIAPPVATPVVPTTSKPGFQPIGSAKATHPSLKVTIVPASQTTAGSSAVAPPVEVNNDILQAGTSKLRHQQSSDFLKYSQRPLSLYSYVKVILDVVSGLIWMHANGIYHSDIKQNNILLDDVDRGTIADFGLSRPYGVSNGGRKGTRGYFPNTLPPIPDEYVVIDPTLDLYAVGCMLDLETTMKSVAPFYHNPINASHVGCSFTPEMIQNLAEGKNIDPETSSPQLINHIFSKMTFLYDSTAISGSIKIPLYEAPLTVDCAREVVDDLKALAVMLKTMSPGMTNNEAAVQMIEELEAYARPEDRTPVYENENRVLITSGVTRFRMAELVLKTMLARMRRDIIGRWGSFVADFEM